MVSWRVRDGKVADATGLLELHRKIGAVPGGVIRKLDEITVAYVDDVLVKSLDRGLILVALDGDQLVGAIHAYTPELHAFRHLLSDLSIVVDPAYQGQGIGRVLFEQFQKRVVSSYSHILRVELYVRVTNEKAIHFYESLGFCQEGIHTDMIWNEIGELETPISMSWRNPNFAGKEKGR